MAGLTLATPIATARGILNDPDAVHYSAADLLQYANDCLDVLVTLLPQLFYEESEHTCAAGAEQALSFDSALQLVDVPRIKNGGVVLPGDRAALDAFDPAWRSGTPGDAVNWMRVNDDDPLRFLVYPPASDGQILNTKIVSIPAEYTISQDTGLPMVLADAITDYIVHRAESRDDEHINSNRAAQFQASFVAKVKG
jgi:hypothetical protein